MSAPARIVTVRRNIENLTNAIAGTERIVAERRAAGLNADYAQAYVETCRRDLEKRKRELATLTAITN